MITAALACRLLRPDVRARHARPVALRTTLYCATLLACAGEARPARELVLASTTSTQDSGLFDVLLPAFESAYPQYDVKLIAVGSGEALALGRRDDADVLLVHAPAAEDAFMRDGHGRTRRRVMSNDFIIAGPAADPAGVRSAASAAEALERIRANRAPFISRGDDSGTHQKERQLWAEAVVVTPSEPDEWYMEVGQGMGDALRIAGERQAYLLTDRATYLFMATTLDLVPLFEGDPALFNPYTVITVNGARNGAGADAFADWIVSPAAQEQIGAYGVERFGRPLFTPAVIRTACAGHACAPAHALVDAVRLRVGVRVRQSMIG